MVKTYKNYLEVVVEAPGGNIRQVLLENGVSKKLFLKLFNQSKIKMSGQTIKKGSLVKEGDIIRLDYLEEEDDLVAKKMDLDIVYEDQDILIVNKISGQVSHPIKYHREATLLNGVKAYFVSQDIRRSPRLINRLDKDTEGLIILGKNPYIDGVLSKMIKEREIRRKYLLVVEGTPSSWAGVINRPILQLDSSMERVISNLGQEAITFYQVLARGKTSSLLEAELKTGRSHQIRVHLKSLGHSIVNDPIYNKNPGTGKMLLCSYYLSFKHPISHREIELSLESRLEDYRSYI